MTLFFHELRQSKLALIIWSAAISFMLGVCIIIYPEMSAQSGWAPACSLRCCFLRCKRSMSIIICSVCSVRRA